MNPSEATHTYKSISLPPVAVPASRESTKTQTSMLLPGVSHSPGTFNPGGDTGAQPIAAVSTPPTISALVQALRRRWLLAFGLAAGAAALVVGAVLAAMPAKYPAQVQLHISSRGDVRVFGEGNDEPEFLLYKKNMEAMIKSQAVLLAALNQKTSTGKDVKDLALVRDQGVEWLETALKTDFLLGPEILKVVLATDRPEEGAELLNAIAKAFALDNFQKDNERREKRLKDFKDNLGKLELELNKLRQQLRSREKSLEVPDEKIRQAQYAAAFQQQLKAAEAVTLNRTEQVKAREELASAQERLKSADQLAISAEKIDEAFRKDERSTDILLEARKIDKEIIDTRTNGQEEFIAPQLQNLELKKVNITQRLDQLKDKLRPEYEKIWRQKHADDLHDRIRLLQDQVVTLEKQEPVLKAELKKTEDEAKKLAPNSQVPLEIVSLQSKITNLESSYGDVGKTIQKMKAEVVNPRVSILQLAAEPKAKDYSRQGKLAGAGGLGIFFLVLFAVAFLEFRTGRISNASEVAQGLGLNIVGSLPLMPASARKGGAGAASGRHAAWQQQLAEAIDGIRTLLVHASRAEDIRVIMVTSATGSEGKTTVATQLAASLARAWKKVLLIDGDLRKPGAHAVFNLPHEPGFGEVLRNEVPAAEVIKPTSLGRLWLMPAGRFDSHAVQALAQDSVRTLFGQLNQQYDFIIIDSCPVLPVADTLLLGQHVDAVLFSILRDVSRTPAVHAAHQKIANLAIRVLGAVMIGAASEAGSLGYGYAGSR
jgi:capsular exopolysaccharide synthesis family protein